MQHKSYSYRIIIVLLFITGWHYAFPVLSSRHFFTNINVRDGLPNQAILAIMRDKAGYMWFGTADGLCRYDGYEFTVYRHVPGDSTTLAGNYIQCLLESSTGKILVGTNSNGLSVYDPLTDSFTNYKHNPSNSTSLNHNNVVDIIQDNHGLIWVGTYAGLSTFDMETGLFTHYRHMPDDPHSISKNGIMDIHEDQAGELWLSTWAQGLCRFNRQQQNFTRYTKETLQNKLFSDYITNIQTDAHGNIWLATSYEGIIIFNPQNEQVQKLNVPSLNGKHMLDLINDNQGNMWVSLLNTGLARIDQKTRQIETFLPSYTDDYSLTDDVILALFYDKFNTLWIGTGNYGIDKYDLYYDFLEYHIIPPDNEAGNTDFKEMLRDASGNIWIRTETAGIVKFSKQSGKHQRFFVPSRQSDVLMNDRIQLFFKDLKGTFRCVYGRQEYKYDNDKDELVKDTFFWFFPDGTRYNGLKYCLLPEGHIWYVSNTGLHFFNASDQKNIRFSDFFKEKTGVSPSTINDIYYNDSKTWFSTRDGLYLYDHADSSFKSFKNDPHNNNTLSGNFVTSTFQDSKERIWITTRSGLNYYDKHSGTFIRYSIKDGLPANLISNLLEDQNGNIWMSSSKGISILNPVKQKVKHLTINNYFALYAGILTKSVHGEIITGGSNNVIIINPKKMDYNPHPPNVKISDFLLYNKPLKPGETKLLKKPVEFTDTIILSHKNSVFGFEFVGLNYMAPDENMYAYKLDGFEERWNYTGSKNRNATYRNVPGGEYVFKVEASNNDGIWIEKPAEITVIILPPWWKTTWARVGTIVLIILLSWIIYMIRVRQIRKRNIILKQLVEQRTKEIEHQNEELVQQADTLQEQNLRLTENQLQIQAQAEELKAQADELTKANDILTKLNDTKNKLLSVIAHDLKNPFQVILNNSRSIAQDLHNFTLSEISGLANTIFSSSREVYHLLENLLEWARAQTDMIKPNPEHLNAQDIITDVINILKPGAEQKSVKIINNINENHHFVADKRMMKVVFRNLIDNAVKYSRANENIIISSFLKNDSLKLYVQDRGTGMNREAQESLFSFDHRKSQPGTRGETGTGLGMSICKDFVEKNRGTISVSSQPGIGSTFTIVFQTEKFKNEETGKQNASEKHNQTDEKEMMEPGLKNQIDQPPVFHTEIEKQIQQSTIVVVEDNESIRKSIVSLLSGFKKVLEAEDGEMGLKVIHENMPDLVISDVKMPKSDGYQLCRKIKTDSHLSHIPVILLTAHSGDYEKFRGLETGADDYLAKPFNPELLMARIKNLIHGRSELKKKFMKDILFNPDDISTTDYDKEFLQKAREIVEKHMSNPEFDSNILIREMGMSRTRMFMKLKALTNQSATEFIRTIRLRKAASLLLSDNLNVSETAYKVGFNNRVYFSKCFTSQFGISPSDYQSKNKTTT